MKRLFAFLLYGFAVFSAYGTPPYGDTVARLDLIDPWVELVKQLETPDPVTPDQIVLEKKLAYDKYTLEDSYPYGKRSRSFQWEKIKENLALLETFTVGLFAEQTQPERRIASGKEVDIGSLQPDCRYVGNGALARYPTL